MGPGERLKSHDSSADDAEERQCAQAGSLDRKAGMRSRTGVVAALVVLAGGVGAALVFHKPLPPQAAVRPDEPIRHRIADGPQFLMEVRAAAPPYSSPSTEPIPDLAARKPIRLIGGLALFEASDEPTPRIARNYPVGPDAALIPPAEETQHYVVDGDTLALLAERYLGDAERAGEIFAVNRDVLTSPDLLPIGAVLRIPRE
jgi:nucleoid-associated protein YgaU